MEQPLTLYTATFTASGVERVVLLHASDEEDARYCVCEGWPDAQEITVTALDQFDVGVIVTVYEHPR